MSEWVYIIGLAVICDVASLALVVAQIAVILRDANQMERQRTEAATGKRANPDR